jgi:hypothetical protein
MVMFAETKGNDQLPVAVHTSCTEDPWDADVGIDDIVIARLVLLSSSSA